MTGIAVAMLRLRLLQEPPRTVLPDTIENEKATFKETTVFLLQRLAFWWIAQDRSTASLIGYGKSNVLSWITRRSSKFRLDFPFVLQSERVVCALP